MSKTINYEGKTYEIGKYYLFSNSDDEFFESYKKLEAVGGCETYPFSAKNTTWKQIKELPSSDNFGTITYAPIELEDGAAYMFESNGSDSVGVYKEKNNKFIGICTYNADHCTNIRKMVVEK